MLAALVRFPSTKSAASLQYAKDSQHHACCKVRRQAIIHQNVVGMLHCERDGDKRSSVSQRALCCLCLCTYVMHVDVLQGL